MSLTAAQSDGKARMTIAGPSSTAVAIFRRVPVGEATVSATQVLVTLEMERAVAVDAVAAAAAAEIRDLRMRMTSSRTHA